jgi:hypothetical protein
MRIAHELGFMALPANDDITESGFYRQRELV